MTPPLVLVHAFPLDSRMFDGIRPAVAGRTRLLTPDLRGFGGGPPLRSIGAAAPDLTVFADDVLAELDTAGIERAVVGGVSMGGYIALNLLRRHPDRVAGLVLADTRSGADDDAALERRRAAADHADRGEIAAGPDAIAPLVADTASGLLRADLAAIAGAVPAATIAWSQRAMAARPDSTAVVAAVTVPVLVVVGEKDTVTPPAVARQLAATAPEAELVELPGVGHLSPAEDPVGFADALIGWLSRRF
ncbi:alpha/beta fold hydrolase [Nakamurella sp.]|uniref:alpha/beta fold hydrolase n=1 Tax=Nakamurella sp. TaxID=1869182 RepID=UPI003782D9B5